MLHRQTLLPATELAFRGHARHDVAEIEALLLLYVLTGQRVQATDPTVALNLPGTHAVHRPPSGPECPATHLQLAKVVLARVETAFSGHLVQLAAPAVVL